MTRLLARSELMRWLRYDEDSGLFYWKARPANRCYVGDLAGHINGKGYREIELRGRVYQAHRLAWLFENGEWPIDEIDHKDGNRSNNRIGNLREATINQNQHNRKKWRRNTSSRFKGVSLHKQTGKWQVNIQLDGCRSYLGLYDSEEIAHQIYKNAADRLHGEFARY